jgi:hypothetical protein
LSSDGSTAPGGSAVLTAGSNPYDFAYEAKRRDKYTLSDEQLQCLIEAEAAAAARNAHVSTATTHGRSPRSSGRRSGAKRSSSSSSSDDGEPSPPAVAGLLDTLNFAVARIMAARDGLVGDVAFADEILDGLEADLVRALRSRQWKTYECSRGMRYRWPGELERHLLNLGHSAKATS